MGEDEGKDIPVQEHPSTTDKVSAVDPNDQNSTSPMPPIPEIQEENTRILDENPRDEVPQEDRPIPGEVEDNLDEVEVESENHGDNAAEVEEEIISAPTSREGKALLSRDPSFNVMRPSTTRSGAHFHILKLRNHQIIMLRRSIETFRNYNRMTLERSNGCNCIATT